MRAILLLLFYISLTSVIGQQPYKVLPWRSELTFNNYLLHKIHAQYDQRRERFQGALQSSSSMVAYRDSCRARYKKILGVLPGRSELKPMLTGTLQKNGYRIEKIIYESVERHHVSTNFYVPDGNGPFPAVLLLCGHEPQAKAADSYQKTAILFALNGFAVLVVDPISQGERHQLVNESGKPLTRGGTTEHTLINAAASLVGSGTVAFELWDNLRALDYLETRPEVDKNRMGCLGNSGGGNQTNYLIGFDERIKVAASSSYISNRERNFDLIGANDGCQHIVNEGKAGLEIID
jgi:cephalosporin-C deacetylase-like acetyl esterase